MTKKKKKVGILQQIIESIRKKWETAGVRDIVYLIAYMAAVAGSYKMMMAAQAIIVTWNPIRWLTGTVPTQEELEKIDVDTMLTAFVVAYIVLKIDADDITSGIAKVATSFAGTGNK